MISSYLLRRDHIVYSADLLENMYKTRLGERRSYDGTISRFASWPVALLKICFVIGTKTYDEKKHAQRTSDQCVGVSQANKFVIWTETFWDLEKCILIGTNTYDWWEEMCPADQYAAQ